VGVNTPKTWFNYLQMFGDLLILNGALALAFTIRSDWNYFFARTELYIGSLALLSFLALVAFNFYGLYNTYNKVWSDILSALIVSLFLVTVTIIALNYSIPAYIFPRRVLFSFVLVYAPAITLWRWQLLMLERKISPYKKVIIIANEVEVLELASKLTGKNKLMGVVIRDSHYPLRNIGRYKVLGTFSQVREVFAAHEPNGVLIPGTLPEELKNLVARLCLKHGCSIYVVPSLYEIMVAQSGLDQLTDTPVIHIAFKTKPGTREIKRFIDCTVSVVTLIVTLPISIAAALAIKLTSPGPVFYLQERVGGKGKHFMLYKFRTMVNKAEARTGPVLCSKKDARVTKVGSILRTFHIDEIPQFINVLKGDMSIVGPRPERPFFVEQFEKEIPGYSYRLLMKAGITGLAQIAGRYSTSPEDKLRYDLLYAKGASPLFDLQIMLQTVKVLFMKDKAS
jgi:exopolysaccharide biosynthesis polyprenyl glycosylphosphotransferase